MRSHLLLSIATLTLATAALAQDRDRGPRPRREAPPVELKHLTFRESSLHSDAVQQDMPFGVYLPLGYDDEANKDVRWPLVIWLHGMFEDHLRFHERGGAEVLDRAIADGKLPPCVFVTANGGRFSMYVNRKDQRWQDLITADLLTHVSKHYRVSTRREQRAILGVSMGGMAALRIAFTHPELFGAVGAHSSAVFPADPAQLPEGMKKRARDFGLDEVFGNPIEMEPWQQANPLCLAEAADVDKLKTLRIYFDAGTRDRYGFDKGNTLLHEALDKRKVEHTWRLIDGGGHSWGAGFQDQTLPFSFAVVGEMFAAAAKPAAKAPAGGSGDSAPATGGDPR
ncbi:MAG: hypothetical protein IT455_09745 [Planctomycetes bacterium]|nr:hypothetical protein [Planctomycetota bacterium]